MKNYWVRLLKHFCGQVQIQISLGYYSDPKLRHTFWKNLITTWLEYHILNNRAIWKPKCIKQNGNVWTLNRSQYYKFWHFKRRKDSLHLENCTYLPLSIGQIWAIVVMPPAPKYCPIDTSSRKTGMPQNIMEMK